MCCAGVTRRTTSHFAASWMSSVAFRLSLKVMLGRYVVLTCFTLMLATTSVSRAHRVTSRPPFAMACARAVPHAPPPITPIDRLEAGIHFILYYALRACFTVFDRLTLVRYTLKSVGF